MTARFGNAEHCVVDLETNHRVAEFNFSHWQGGADTIRQNSLFKDFFQLAEYQTLFGDWRQLFREVEEIDRVTPGDVRRVASSLFVPTNRTVGAIESTKTGAAPRGDAQ